MKVLIIYAHPNTMSFTKAYLFSEAQGCANTAKESSRSGCARIHNTDDPTFFNEIVYREKGFRESMEKIIDNWSLKYPGIQTVDHIYFHSILAVDNDTRKKYLEIAYLKGKNL